MGRCFGMGKVSRSGLSAARTGQGGFGSKPRTQNPSPDPFPAVLGCQLLRSVGQSTQKEAQARQQALGVRGLGVRAGQPQGELASALDHSAHGAQQQWPARHRFARSFRFGAAHEQTPPVVNQRHVAGRDLAAQEVLGREAAQPHWFFSSS